MFARVKSLADKVYRGIQNPPKIIAKRVYQEARAEFERFIIPYKAKQFGLSQLLKLTNAPSLDELWQRLASRPYFAQADDSILPLLDQQCPEHRDVILEKAELALQHRIDLLGSGLIDLGSKIDWHKDYKTNYRWKPDYFRSINYCNPERPSDVKMPWEMSRLQWLLPAAQAYIFTKEEKYAEGVKRILLDWINENPVAQSVNWSCTMEAALRIFTFTWLFHACQNSHAWCDEKFRIKFLCSIYQHGDFTERYIEECNVNGNHFTADAAAMVVAGLFFGIGTNPVRWQARGWDKLQRELPRQVYDDGVDFEASTAYHRLVLELFFLPARYREVCGLSVPPAYRERACRMAEYSISYSQPGGHIPLWGDADDARALPFGEQAINDHRYLAAYVGQQWQHHDLLAAASGGQSEVIWLHGYLDEQAKTDPASDLPLLQSKAYPDGGFFIMRNQRSHVFIDCGRLGLADRGGHGHNDALSFAAVLNGHELISDCGAYLYTASYKERNLFRSTAYHNTPQINGEEINRFVRWDWLWNFENDAKPRLVTWQPSREKDLFCGEHIGYQRLAQPLTITRRIVLIHESNVLLICDELIGDGKYTLSIPYHLAPTVNIEHCSTDKIQLSSLDAKFQLTLISDPYQGQLEQAPCRISPTYGIFEPSHKLLYQAENASRGSIIMALHPQDVTLPSNETIHELLGLT